jgi:hypothetical protein
MGKCSYSFQFDSDDWWIIRAVQNQVDRQWTYVHSEICKVKKHDHNFFDIYFLLIIWKAFTDLYMPSAAYISSPSSLHAFKDLRLVASCRLNINVQPLSNGHSGFCFPAGWYCIIVCVSLDVTIVLTCCIHILLQLLICTKIVCVLSSFIISLFLLWSKCVYFTVFLSFFVSAVVILALPFSFNFPVSLPYSRVSVSIVLYIHYLVHFWALEDVRTWLFTPVVCKKYVNFLIM